MRLSRLDAYIALLCVLALGVVAHLGHLLLGADLQRPSDVALVLALLILVGEAYPIVLSRGEDEVDEVTISATFVLGVAMLGPLWLLVPAQVVAATVDDVRRGKELRKLVFNCAQLVLTASLTRAAFCLVSGRAYLADEAPVTMRDVGAALVAAAVFYVVNNGLTGTVVAISMDQPVLHHLREDARLQLSTSGVLLSFAPVIVVASDFSLLLLPLMLLPIVAVHRSAALAAERERQALHDGLTGLPNRLFLHERTTRLLGEAERTGACTGVLLLDLDHFKEINDTLGHYVGDQLIREVATRLRSALREGDTVARLGGDEFAVLTTDLHDAEDARQVAGRLLAALAEPLTIDGVRLDVQASVGIAVSPQHGSDATTLLQRADVALYAAKENRGCAALYEPEGDLHSPEKLALLGELRQGIPAGQLRVHYQPKCDARSGRVVGLEALVRWQHPTRGLVPPDEFIPVAENTGLIGALTLHVLDQALRQARALRDAGRPLGVSVNLSVRVLTDLDLPRQVAGLLGTHGVPADQLTLEVTESTIMVDPVRTMQVLGLLRDVGVVLSIDDFGTGYSSLAYLKRLQAHELKIDKSFVTTMSSNSNDAVIVRSTIELGHNLGLMLVAEGVEDAETWQLLSALGCDVVQGYHLSRPLAPEALDRWLDEHEVTRAAVVAALRQPEQPRSREFARSDLRS